jgi:hypothetical protein
MTNRLTRTTHRLHRCRPASLLGIIGLTFAAGGCSSESKEGLPPSEAIPAASQAPSPLPNGPGAIAGPVATAPPSAVNPFSDHYRTPSASSGSVVVASTPSFTRPESSSPYGYPSGGGGAYPGSAAVRYGSAGPSFTQGGVRYGSAGPYNGSRPTFGSGVAYRGSAGPYYGSRPTSGSGFAYRGSAGPYYGARPTLGSGMASQNGAGYAGPTSPSDARLAELERRAAELEQRVQALLPAVRRAAESSK